MAPAASTSRRNEWLQLAILPGFSHAVHDRGNPCRRVPGVFNQFAFVGIRQAFGEQRTGLVIDMVPADPAQGLDRHAAGRAGGGHVAQGGVPYDDLLFPDSDPARASVGKKHGPRRHLIRETEDIGGVCAGRLESGRITALERLGNGIG